MRESEIDKFYFSHYYLNDNIFNNTFHQKINATALNDVYFQQNLFEGAFDVEDMIKLGYYPQVKFSSQQMPQQHYGNQMGQQLEMMHQQQSQSVPNQPINFVYGPQNNNQNM